MAHQKRTGPVDLIVANNVFAHIDNLEETISAVDLLLKEDGSLIFEVQYLVDLLDNGMFDMIYHEHHDYHHMGPLIKFFKDRRYSVVEWERIPDHGGSIRVTVRKNGESVDTPEETLDWPGFHKKIQDAKYRTWDSLSGRVVAFGATAKACTLIHHFGLAESIDYCVDETPTKLGRYIPGTDIRIRHPDLMEENPPDTLFLTAWNYADLIKRRFPQYRVVTPF